MKICNKEFRKIPSNHENPLDDMIIRFINYFDLNIFNLKTDPNYISIFRFVVFSYFWYNYINNVNKKNAYMLLFIFFFNYLLDCVDGYLARKCDCVTVLGDVIDHVADITISIMLIYTMCPLEFIDITILLLTFGLSTAHFGCQQRYYNNTNENKELLDLLKPLCFTNYKYLRYFSAVTLVIVFGIMFYYKNIKIY